MGKSTYGGHVPRNHPMFDEGLQIYSPYWSSAMRIYRVSGPEEFERLTGLPSSELVISRTRGNKRAPSPQPTGADPRLVRAVGTPHPRIRMRSKSSPPRRVSGRRQPPRQPV
jgi:hypothetical protein